MFWIVLASALAADQITKLIVANSMTIGESIPALGDFLHFTYVINDGASFSILEGQRWIFILLTLIVLAVVLLLYIKKVPKDMKLFCAVLGLFCGGTIGNLVDRIYLGGVIDFLDLSWFPVFNIADCCICVGAVSICLMLILGKPGKLLEDNKKKAGSK